MAMFGQVRKRQNLQRRQGGGHGSVWKNGGNLIISNKRLFRVFIVTLALIALGPPLYFHFRLRRFHQVQFVKCSWLRNPPLVCAHGGDSIKQFPNTRAAYNSALRSQVDCIEIDISRSSDGVLFALHDRDLQRISGDNTSKVGHLSRREMPSRATPKPSSRAVQGAGYHGFRSLQDHLWYQAYFARRTIVVERPISTPTRATNSFFFTAFRARRGWVAALSRRRECNATIVREFCTSLIQVDHFYYEAYVRGRAIAFTPAMIAAVLDVDEEPNYQCPFPLDAASPTPDEVATKLTGQPTTWTDSRLPANTWTPGYRLLFLAVAGCILPTTYTATIDFERARIIYAIGR